VTARTSKLATPAEAAALVADGDVVAIGGIHAHSGPVAIVRELIRAGRRDLTLLPNVSAGLPADLLIAGGCVSRIYCCYMGLEHKGLAPAFRRAAEAGTIEVRDVDEPFTVYALKAASANLPFMALPHGHRATQTMELNPDDYRLVRDPFTGEEHVCIPQVQPDVGLIHAAACDPYGNVHIPGAIFHDDLVAKASKRVIVTTDRVVPHEVAKADPRWTTIPGLFVTAVVPLPYAAHPTSSQGNYGYDEAHIEEYRDADPGAYLERYVLGVADHHEYLEQVGLRRLASLQLGAAVA
jgi:glutaconate CoA-transferase subunit A